MPTLIDAWAAAYEALDKPHRELLGHLGRLFPQQKWWHWTPNHFAPNNLEMTLPPLTEDQRRALLGLGFSHVNGVRIDYVYSPTMLHVEPFDSVHGTGSATCQDPAILGSRID